MSNLLLIVLIISVSVQNSSAVINQVNHIEHARMPPVFHLDRYDACLLQDNGTGEYCSMQLDLVSEQPSQLYDFITDYSAKRQKHMNHTSIFRGICLTKTCSHFYTRNTTADRRETLEACLNESIWNEYKLKTRVADVTCQTLDSKLELDFYDYVVAACFFLLLALNLLGTLQVLYFGEENEAKGNAFLSCFSIGRNWRKLVAPAGEGPDPRLRGLVGFNGIKAICIIYMVTGHGLFPLAFDSEDTYLTEKFYYSTVFLLYISCGMLMVQWCLMVSSFLLFYNMEIYAETHKVTWKMVPKAILFRWLRFTPAYVFVLIFSATWLRHSGNGPLWKESVMYEVSDCRRNWWINLFYINNYVDSDLCFLQTWYIAADFQLFIVGMAVYVLTAGLGRKIVLALLLIFGAVTSAAHTYVNDLDGQQLLSSENIRRIFNNDPTFHLFYKRGHTNLPSYITGLATGLLVYHCQKSGYKIPNTTRVRFIYWLTYPIVFVLIGYFGITLYENDTSLYYRTLYAGLAKPLFAINGAFFLFGMVYQFEDFYRGIVEWPGWTVPSRLSYSLFLVHIQLIRILTGTRTTTMDGSNLHLIEMLASTFILSMLVAFPFHLLVEAPFNQLFKLWMSPSSKHHTDDVKLASGAKDEHKDDKGKHKVANRGSEAMPGEDENSPVRRRRFQKIDEEER